MFEKINFINKKILIYGLGLSGKSCFQYLYKKNKVFIYDDNNSLKIKKFKLFFLNKNQVLKQYFDFIILSPGIDINKCKLKKYLLRNHKKIITELDIFNLIFPNNLKITITGTNGKSTTCQMLYEIFKSNSVDVSLVGNIGNPPLLEKNIKKKLYLLLRHHHIRYHIINISHQIMLPF